MKCPSCGTGLEASARFCGVCGHRLQVPEKQAKLAAPAAGVPAGMALPVSDRDPYIGTVLNNRFKIESKLGEGGFGAVYRGIQQGIGRVVALKLLHPEMTRDGNLIARFRREGLVLCNLNDAHTITTYDFDQTPDGTLYIAMELLEGKSLHDVFHEEAPIRWRRMCKIVSQMCTSLSEAHSQGIVHRDLKPENIHLENRPGNPEFVKILDFGIAKVMHGDGAGNQSPQLTATGQTLGTLEYMSPEQLMGKPLDGRSDVYALGVVTYELISGRLPFPDAKGPAGLITAQLRQVPDPLSKAAPAGEIPPGLDACVHKMLEKDKNKRFADVNELRQEIDRILATDGTVASAHPNLVARPARAQASGPVSAPPQQARGSVPQQQPAYQQQARPQQGRAAPSGPSTRAAMAAAKGSLAWLWIVLAILAVGGAVGAALALK